MADKKISELAAAAALDTDDLLAVVEDGTTKKATIQDILDLAPSGNGIPTVINAVTDYGATGNGSTNDRTALADALSAADAAGGGIVYLPAGTYQVGVSGTTGAMLTVPSKVTLRGEGPRATIIRSGSTVVGHDCIQFETGATDARIESLGVTASTGTVTGVAVFFDAAVGCSIVDCWLDDKHGWGISANTNSQYLDIVRCVFEGTQGSNAIEINKSSYVNIESNHIFGSGNNAIELWGESGGFASGLRVIDNHIVGPDKSAIIGFAIIGAIIQGNRISDPGVNGISLVEDETSSTYFSRECIVSGNVVKGANVANLGGGGISLSTKARRNTIQGNTVEGTLNGHGIAVLGIDNTVTGNVSYLNDGFGIYASAARATVTGNVAVDNSLLGVGSYDGIRVEGDYSKVIGNVGSDTRGGSNRQQFGVGATTGTGIVLIGNGGTGNTGHAVYDGATASIRLGNEGVGAVDTFPQPVVNSATAGTTETLDGDSYNIHDIFLDENCTFTFTTAAVAAQFTLILRQDGTGGNTVTWPGSVKWHAATPPTILTTANAVHVLEFLTVNTGGEWRGFLASSSVS